MSTNTESAVTSVTPKTRAKALNAAPAASVSAPVPAARKGRAPIVLKGGILLADARKNAANAVATAKLDLRSAKTSLVNAEKAKKAADNQLAKANKAQATADAALAKAPKDTSLKQAAKDAKIDVKLAEKTLKELSRSVEAAQKAVAKAQAGVDKAQAGVQKVEDQYKALQAK